ncbi:SpoIIE family protein phosphatase [Streptomyces polyrhachis]|uniref:SpoIIE family protein phosphatase n=1 Tax=Streptomyces polyrhachis TaxID=1282885 RepID=A0ABW2GGS3_9ACTN
MRSAGPDGGSTDPAGGRPPHIEPPAPRPAPEADAVRPRPQHPEPPHQGPDQGSGRLRFVGAATRRIARGIDLDEIVLGLCRSVVPAFADAILVYLRDPLPVGDEQPAEPFELRLRRTDLDTAAPGVPALPGPSELIEVAPMGALSEVLRGVRPVFGDTLAARSALAELIGKGGGSGPSTVPPPGRRTIIAPLRGRRRVTGVVVLLRGAHREPYERDDLLVAAQLATHTALGIDKAEVYRREAYIADELQRTMLPESLPQPTGVKLASRYLPAAESARVGGDWYDAIPLPGSRVALIVGDVMGHSVASAAIMGQLRTATQTLAGLDLPPHEVLHHLDEQAQRLGEERMATCLYAIYDPIAQRLTLSNAGHPPPVLLHGDGRSEVLDVPPGAPIGVGGTVFESVELDVPAGATLLLYTDGLVESRLCDVSTGIDRLCERLSRSATLADPLHPSALEALCEEVLDVLDPTTRDDDIALLAARLDGIAPSSAAQWQLEPHTQAPREARRHARAALAGWGLEDLTDSVELLVSEVVTNAIRYARRPVSLRLVNGQRLRCEVVDDVPQLPRLRRAGPADEGGRGMFLVNRVAKDWGAERLSTGKVVWFEV